MKHYISTIPPTLAEKLKEKGMPILIEQEWYDNGMPKAEKDCHKPMTKFCEVFDWLMSEKIVINIEAYNADIDRTCIKFCWLIFHFKDGTNPYHKGHYTTWHEAAEAAIKKALTLI